MTGQVGRVSKGLAVAALFAAALMPHSAHAQSATDAATAADPVPTWWSEGTIEAGGRFFLNNPQRNGSNYLGQNSLAKYYEYSDIKPGAFGDAAVRAGSSDGTYGVGLWADNIGYNDQRYLLDLSKLGEHYLTLQ